MSTPKDRLFEVYLAYQAALARRAPDLAEAASHTQVTQILTHIDKLQSQYFKAALGELNATGADVEQALTDATKASADATAAYEAAVQLAERIRLVAKVVSKIGDLVKKAVA
jgi:hypothetical protein